MDYRFIKAIDTARRAHAFQLRKYTNEPYLVHPFAVAGLVASVTSDENMIISAILHDVVEDSDITIQEIDNSFGYQVATMVSGLTDVSEAGYGNRAARKKIDRQHIAIQRAGVKTIKLADLIDNTKTILAFDLEFAKVYMEEKRLLLEHLTEGDPKLFDIAEAQIKNYFK